MANIETAKQRVLAHTMAQLALALEVAVADLFPQATESTDRQQVVDELSQKLPTKYARSLATRLLSKHT